MSTIRDDQITIIKNFLEKDESKINKLCKHYGIDSISQLSQIAAAAIVGVILTREKLKQEELNEKN
jgi:ABC-type proline/glycine betaine transport system permease subunit